MVCKDGPKLLASKLELALVAAILAVQLSSSRTLLGGLAGHCQLQPRVLRMSP